MVSTGRSFLSFSLGPAILVESFGAGCVFTGANLVHSLVSTQRHPMLEVPDSREALEKEKDSQSRFLMCRTTCKSRAASRARGTPHENVKRNVDFTRSEANASTPEKSGGKERDTESHIEIQDSKSDGGGLWEKGACLCWALMI
ncbi:hypothetical protein DFH06DRAFT_1130703 [Mycena polygramma]|nr:hypothetical protein DFH06DRAFT_1130703 [Mycena polygramma]